MFKSTRQSSPPSRQSPQPWKPHAYQKKAMKFMLKNACAALLLDPGLGKTSTTLAAFKVLQTEKLVRSMLVVAPLRPATEVWPAEIEGWKEFAGLDYVVLHGKDKESLAKEKHDVYIVNYEGLQWLIKREKVGKTYKTYLTEAGKALFTQCDMLVWDELSKMKHSDTLRFKLMKPFLKKFSRRYGLTGSPAPNGLMDLFGQLYVLDEGRTLGQYITHYRNQYFLPAGYMSMDWVLRKGADKEIQERIKPIALRMEAADYLELPTLLEHTVRFKLPPDAQKHYELMEDELMTVVNERVVSAASAAAAVSKCRQICSGAVYKNRTDPVTGEPLDGLGARWDTLHTAKLDALDELLGELQGKQVLVMYDFRHDLERLLAKYKGTPNIGGGVSPVLVKKHLEAWNAGTLPLLFGHPASMGHGLNMQKSNAAHIVWFTLTWDFELYDQLNKRLLRQGNTAAHVHVYHLVAKGTVEESVASALRRKFKTQKELMDAIKTKR